MKPPKKRIIPQTMPWKSVDVLLGERKIAGIVPCFFSEVDAMIHDIAVQQMKSRQEFLAQVLKSKVGQDLNQETATRITVVKRADVPLVESYYWDFGLPSRFGYA